MMIFSILPAYALHTKSPDAPDDGSFCHGEPRSPWKHLPAISPPEQEVDDNGNKNGFICFNNRSNMVQDDIKPRIR